MFENIDPASATPLYAQIASCIQVAIAAGELSSGNPLPSVRQLASQLRVNPATVVQAYRELESQKLVETRHGAGTFVTAISSERRRREREALARRMVRELIADSSKLGFAPEDLLAIIHDELLRNVA